MKAPKISSKILLLILTFTLLAACQNKTSQDVDPIAALLTKNYVESNVTYLKIDSLELKCDVFMPGKQLGEQPWIETTNDNKPTLLYIHGGGWTNLNRTIRTLDLMPYVNKGWCVVNIDYRLIQQAPFPACIADCRYALNWIYENAAKYKFDTTRIVVSGESAGGHLALMTGMLDNDSIINIIGFPIKRKLQVAAIVNWYGISDMNLILQQFNSLEFTKQLIGDLSKKEYIQRISSPINYVRRNQPPVLSVHGDIDPIVSYYQSSHLHHLLDSLKVKNKLITMKGRKHGNFTAKEESDAFREIWKFLDDIGIH
jgi:acetyl esterase/lipase